MIYTQLTVSMAGYITFRNPFYIPRKGGISMSKKKLKKLFLGTSLFAIRFTFHEKAVFQCPKKNSRALLPIY